MVAGQGLRDNGVDGGGAATAFFLVRPRETRVPPVSR